LIGALAAVDAGIASTIVAPNWYALGVPLLFADEYPYRDTELGRRPQRTGPAEIRPDDYPPRDPDEPATVPHPRAESEPADGGRRDEAAVPANRRRQRTRMTR
jgi:hypothetical protein